MWGELLVLEVLEEFTEGERFRKGEQFIHNWLEDGFHFKPNTGDTRAHFDTATEILNTRCACGHKAIRHNGGKCWSGSSVNSCACSEFKKAPYEGPFVSGC